MDVHGWDWRMQQRYTMDAVVTVKEMAEDLGSSY